MKRQHLGTLISSILTLAIIFWLVKEKKGAWWYVGTFLLISPILYGIGYSIGKDDPEELKRQQEAIKQQGIESDRQRKCRDLGGFYSSGQCKKFDKGEIKVISLS